MVSDSYCNNCNLLWIGIGGELIEEKIRIRMKKLWKKNVILQK